MKKLFILSILLLLGMVTRASEPKFYTWVNYSADRDWDTYFAQMADVGFNGIVISADKKGLEAVVPIAKKYGIAVHAWAWILNNGTIAKAHPEWLDYNAKGESLKDKKAYVEYYKFLSPIIPGVRQTIADYVESLAAIDGVQSVSLDYCRYVDAILPKTLWKNYGVIQDKVYPEWDYGYHPDMIAAFEAKYGYNPQKLADPTLDTLWRNFRLNAVDELVVMLKERVAKHGVKLSASPFPTPQMSREMVYQNWGAWPLDIAFPMIYSGFYEQEIDWVKQCVADCRAQMSPDAELVLGYMPHDALNKDYTIVDVVKQAMESGANGISLFMFDSLKPEQKQALKTYIASLRAQKCGQCR